MLSHHELNMAWEQALRNYSKVILQGDHGPYSPIGYKTMCLLNPLWQARHREELPDLGQRLIKGQDIRIFGDPHFEHANILWMCKRPFDTCETMDQTLWTSVCAAHEEADFVVCVGDWAMKNPIGWQRKINNLYPDKQLTVVGNHDAKGSKPPQWLESGAFASLAFTVPRELIEGWVKRYEPDTVDLVEWTKLPKHISVGVSHWPIPPQYMPGPGWINLHGHIHNRPNSPLRINCSMEAIDYIPRRIDQLIDARVMDELVRRQSGLEGFIEAASSDLAQHAML